MAKPPNPELVLRILSIALEELGSNSPVQVNMRTIAAKAGISATTIYYYFASKEELFERIKFDAMAELEARISEAVAGLSGALEQLKALCRAFVAWSLERPHLADLLMEELPPREVLDEERMGRYYAVFAHAAKLVEKSIAEGSLESRDVMLDVSVAQAALWGIAVQFRTKRVHPTHWASIDPLVERFIELFTGKTGGRE